MKKGFLFFLFVVCLTLMLSTMSSAENGTDNGINLSSLSTEQLLTLREQLESEFAKRGIDDTNLLSLGSYVAGKDIAPGNYILHIYNEESGSMYVVVLKEGVDPAILLGSYSEDNFTKMVSYPVEIKQSSEMRISLEEGQVLCMVPARIEDGFSGIITIEKTSGLFME